MYFIQYMLYLMSIDVFHHFSFWMINYLVLAQDKNCDFVCLYHLIALICFHACEFALKWENFTLFYSLSLLWNLEHINIWPIKIFLGKEDKIFKILELFEVSLDCKFRNHFANVGQPSRITTTYWDWKNWMTELYY